MKILHIAKIILIYSWVVLDYSTYRVLQYNQILTADDCRIFWHQYEGPQVHFSPPKRRASTFANPIITRRNALNRKILHLVFDDEKVAILNMIKNNFSVVVFFK